MNTAGAYPLTYASFFTGAGGLDIGFMRAGWTMLSASEIDPYASALLRHRFAGVPNLGDILRISPEDIPDATLWTGGFPCQDLSIAGKRRGLAGARSGLAFAFLDLVERRRPTAILLENVPGLLSSHAGRDFYALQRRMAELGYVGAYRVLDAQYFGVPQRRRRVFVLALDAGRGFGDDAAAEVLAVGTRCGRHPAPGTASGAQATARDPQEGAGVVGTLDANEGAKWGSNQWTYTGHAIPVGREWDTQVAPSLTTSQDRRSAPGDELYVANQAAHSDGSGAADGLARRLDDSPGLAPSRLDSHRFRLAGNGVVAPVAQWIAQHLAGVLA